MLSVMVAVWTPDGSNTAMRPRSESATNRWPVPFVITPSGVLNPPPEPPVPSMRPS